MLHPPPPAKRILTDTAAGTNSAKRARPSSDVGGSGGKVSSSLRKGCRTSAGPRLVPGIRRNARKVLRNAASRRRLLLDTSNNAEAASLLPANSLLSDLRKSSGSGFLDQLSAMNLDTIGDIVPTDYRPRFRVNRYRPVHGGLCYPQAQAGADAFPPPGTLKGDMLRALELAQPHDSTMATDPGPSYIPSAANARLESLFAALACGMYANSEAPRVLAFALLGCYPAKRLSAASLDSADAELLRTLRAAEKHGYRVSLAQLDVSHFGNPLHRRLNSRHLTHEQTEEMDGVRAVQARAHAFRDISGYRVFATGSEMLLTDESLLNGHELWDAVPDWIVEHYDTKDGLAAYYDIEHTFTRTAVLLWRNEDHGCVILEHAGAEEIARHLALIGALHPAAIGLLHRDVVDPVLDDALAILEAPDKSWRRLRCGTDGKLALARVLLRIAGCRGLDWVPARVLDHESVPLAH